MGGPQIAATSGEPWIADPDTNPLPYRTNGKAKSTADAITLDASVPVDTPSGLFQTYREEFESVWADSRPVS